MAARKKSYEREAVRDRLLEYRESILGLTQAQLAEALDFSIHTLRSYEQARADLSVDFLARLRVTFHLDPAWLLLGLGDHFSWLVPENLFTLVYASARSVQEVCAGEEKLLSPDSYAAIVELVFRKFRESGQPLDQDILRAMVRLAT